MEIRPTHLARCHCGAVELEIQLPNGLVDPRRCDCSFCSKRQAIAASAGLDDIKIIKGADKLSLYQFGTKTAKHYFCSECGIYTHHQRRSNPNEYGFNIACLEGVNPFELGEVGVADGVNHPSDRNPSKLSASAKELLDRAYSIETDQDSRALYGDWADTYDKTMVDGLSYLTPTRTAEMLARHLSNKGARVLDVGSGTGLAGEALAQLGFQNIDALDYSSEMLSVAGQKKIYKNLIEADLNQHLDIGADTYQAMICTGTFTHAHVGAGALDELFRILNPDGLFACTVQKDIWNDAGFKERVSKLETTGSIVTLEKSLGTYFKDSDQPEGWFIVWKKCK